MKPRKFTITSDATSDHEKKKEKKAASNWQQRIASSVVFTPHDNICTESEID